ncbi:alpha/beta hydrolase [Aquabacterium sp. CECT 9606]|uniref:alpha/beta hydrolase n=1 Tax=Aquabacterium sp. CECT 9606 TaxID=2845822 RepID=UPI001E3A1E91|nr:alpha/beta hydrolase [Aquabacterium sp. CECT 9606]CAH0352359.1 Acetyl esterase [Aquabacterium sp. CECT 9606]
MALHPDLEAFLELVNSGDRPAMNQVGVAQARADYNASTLALDAPGAAPDSVQNLTLPCRDGALIKARLYKTKPVGAAALPVLLYFHGGGYTVGGLESHDSLCAAIAVNTPCAVLAVDYRLAPEHRFPVAFHDAEDALRWLQSQGPSHGLDTRRIAVGGDSAGGTLATALTIATRETGAEQPCLQVLLYPCTLGHQDSASHQRFATGHLLEATTLRWMYANYLRSNEDRTDWRFAPLQATDLRGVAPAFIALADHDPLLDEGLAYADRLRHEDVTVQLKVYEGMVHDFARLGNIVDEADQVRADIAQALASAFHHHTAA